MNYYNPYFYTMPNNLVNNTARTGFLSRLFGRNITFSEILNGTQKALNFANQAIPLVKQVRPMIGNAKTMFKLMNEFKKVEKPNNNVLPNKTNSNTNTNNLNNNIKSNNTSNIVENDYIESNDYGPQFFI